MNEIKFTVYGKSFSTLEKAELYKKETDSLILEQKKKENKIRQEMVEKKNILFGNCKSLYREKGFDDRMCTCNKYFSETCLVHFCSCSAGICDRHTSRDNQGCYWCGYTDCNKWNC